MDAKDARERLRGMPTEYGRLHGELERMAYARGYLYALEDGPEVNVLVKAMSTARHQFLNEFGDPYDTLNKALIQFLQMKEGGK
jgi:hypothetical protein